VTLEEALFCAHNQAPFLVDSALALRARLWAEGDTRSPWVEAAWMLLQSEESVLDALAALCPGPAHRLWLSRGSRFILI
jgi:hypothetical protein